jgi:hypothetical protein
MKGGYMNVLYNFILPGIIFLFTLAFGVWLSRTGRPYNTILFNTHKLIALGAVIFAALRLYGVLKAMQIQVLPIMMLVILGLCVLALFITGALMSAGKLDRMVMLTIHRIAPALAAISASMIIYFLGAGIDRLLKQ